MKAKRDGHTRRETSTTSETKLLKTEFKADPPDDQKGCCKRPPCSAPHVVSLVIPAIHEVDDGIGCPAETAKAIGDTYGKHIVNQNSERGPVHVDDKLKMRLDLRC